MRKNKMMRLASVLLVLTLLTTCMISGTFAKYVTTASGNDTARVAKWGVEVTSTSDMFNTEYETLDGALKTTIANSVATSPATGADGKELVAPGTTKTDVAFTISGTPEVAVNIAVTMAGKNGTTEVEDVFLKAGTYTDYTAVTGYDAAGKPTYGEFTLNADYHPLKWTLKNGTKELLKDKTLAEVQQYLTKTSADGSAATNGLSGNYAPNTNLATLDGTNGEYELSWSWAIEENNAADTFLGNLAAGTATTDSTNYCLDISYDLAITVTQID